MYLTSKTMWTTVSKLAMPFSTDQFLTQQFWWRQVEIWEKGCFWTYTHLNSRILVLPVVAQRCDLSQDTVSTGSDYTAKHADNTGLLGELNDRPYVKSWAQYKWSINVSYHLCHFHESFIFSQSTLPPLLCSIYLHCSLLGAHMPCPLLWAVISLCLYKPIFKISFLSLFPVSPQAVTSSSRAFLLLPGVCAPSPWDSWAQLFAFSINFSQSPFLFLLCGFHTSCLTWRAFCSPLSWCTLCSPCRSSPVYAFCVLYLALLLPTFSFHSQGPPLPQLEIHCLYFPHFFPKDLQIWFYQHIICLSLSFFPWNPF